MTTSISMLVFFCISLRTPTELYDTQDCWSLQARDASTGKIVPDPAKFPNGIAAVATQMHAFGLKMGIYRFSRDYRLR